MNAFTKASEEDCTEKENQSYVSKWSLYRTPFVHQMTIFPEKSIHFWCSGDTTKSITFTFHWEFFLFFCDFSHRFNSFMNSECWMQIENHCAAFNNSLSSQKYEFFNRMKEERKNTHRIFTIAIWEHCENKPQSSWCAMNAMCNKWNKL